MIFCFLAERLLYSQTNTLKMKKSILLSLAALLLLAACAPKQSENAPETTYPMIEQTTPNPENAAEAQQFLKKCGTYYLATVEGDQPRVRPIGIFLKYNRNFFEQ